MVFTCQIVRGSSAFCLEHVRAGGVGVGYYTFPLDHSVLVQSDI